eukprot:SAG22_NODE_3614_length_1616_cov_1.177324_1_plen_388_part_01
MTATTTTHVDVVRLAWAVTLVLVCLLLAPSRIVAGAPAGDGGAAPRYDAMLPSPTTAHGPARRRLYVGSRGPNDENVEYLASSLAPTTLTTEANGVIDGMRRTQEVDPCDGEGITLTDAGALDFDEGQDMMHDTFNVTNGSTSSSSQYDQTAFNQSFGLTANSIVPDSRFVQNDNVLLALNWTGTGLPVQSHATGQDMPDSHSVITNGSTSGSDQYDQSTDNLDGHSIIIPSFDKSDNSVVSGGHFVHNDNVHQLALQYLTKPPLGLPGHFRTRPDQILQVDPSFNGSRSASQIDCVATQLKVNDDGLANSVHVRAHNGQPRRTTEESPRRQLQFNSVSPFGVPTGHPQTGGMLPSFAPLQATALVARTDSSKGGMLLDATGDGTADD